MYLNTDKVLLATDEMGGICSTHERPEMRAKF